ncbi:MAG TPA: excinuclease ABC subunit UvrC [Firmicutes bacterium]|nr:excinuclease ABC subunit UvrC [Bacillota bacterium]
MNEKIKILRKKAMSLPLEPGVYLMKNKSGKIIYVGKAKALKNRVSQYFGSDKNHEEKVKKMVENVDDFDYILCDSEHEALILECSLIKQYNPKYNILLKYESGYHYIRISPRPYSKITAVRKIDDDGAQYLGPYMSGFIVKNIVEEANSIFRLSTCGKVFPRDIGKERPCLNYHIKRCSAPCARKISEDEYDASVRRAVEYIKGGAASSIEALKAQMMQAADNLDFERAAKIRDNIYSIQRVTAKQKVIMSPIPEQDIIALANGIKESCFEVFRFKSGRLADDEHFMLDRVENPKQARAEFVARYYTMREDVPSRVVLDGECDDAELLNEWLTNKRGKKAEISVPQKGRQLELVEMCRKNAAEHLSNKTGRPVREVSALNELASLLGLPEPPMYIESYDISNTAGSENVAGMVVFEEGRPLKSAYRRFKIKGFEGQDDYASMHEVISRRLEEYEKHKDEGEGFGRLPDLILLDGGKGQVSAVMPAIEKSGLNIPVFGMVKDSKHKTSAITTTGSEIAIKSTRSAYTLVSKIQEEVHRFAISYHRQRRSKSAVSSVLQEIEGVGKSRASALLKHFKSMKAIKAASIDELASVKGISRSAAEKIYEYFNGEADNRSEQ